MMFRLLSLSALATTALVGLGAPAMAGGCYASSCYRAPVSNCGGGSCYKLVAKPPVYGTVDESYVVRPERTFSRVVPAQYETVTEKVMVQPERRIARHIPAQYRTVSEKVLISPATRRWEVSRDAYGQTTGCWVDVPAQYGYQQRTVQVSPASVDYDVVPAVYGERSRRVMVSATRVVHETVPAEYATRQRQVMVSPGSQYWARSGY
jgi:hypothetical protein